MTPKSKYVFGQLGIIVVLAFGLQHQQKREPALRLELHYLGLPNPTEAETMAMSAASEAVLARDASSVIDKMRLIQSSFKKFKQATLIAPEDAYVRILRLNTLRAIPKFLQDQRDIDEDLKLLESSKTVSSEFRKPICDTLRLWSRPVSMFCRDEVKNEN